MASIVSAGTTSGTSLNLSGDTSGVLQLATNGTTTAVTIDTSQNVLVGGTTQRLNAKITNNGAYWSGSGNSSGDAEYFLSNYATPTCAWTMSVRQDVGGANNDLKFLRLNSSGSFQDIAMQITQAEGNVNLIKNLGIGGATATTSGTGITFPATQSASSNANTLDDYEEGTFTPVLVPGSGSITTQRAYGYYTKIGNSVTVLFAVSIDNGGTASGVGTLTGLPFTSQSVTPSIAGNRAGTCAAREDGLTGNWYFGYVLSNTTQMVLSTSTNGALSYTNTSAYVASFVYRTA